MEENFREKKKGYVYLFSFILPLLIIISSILYYNTNDLRSFYLIFLYFVISCFLDYFLGTSTVKYNQSKESFYTGIIYFHILIHFFIFPVFLYFMYISNDTYTLLIISLSYGFYLGSIGINLGHEILHKRGFINKTLGYYLLYCLGYSHFNFEHNIIHHRYVATKKDPVTAKINETFFIFLFKAVAKQYIDVIKMAFTTKNKKIKNQIILTQIIQFFIFILFFYFFGFQKLLFFILMGFVGIFLLEAINYMRHYGLSRELDERLTFNHSWQSTHKWSRWTLFDLTLHSSHHLKANLEYQDLEIYKDGKFLPYGYYVSSLIIFFPFLWKKIMNKRI